MFGEIASPGGVNCFPFVSFKLGAKSSDLFSRFLSSGWGRQAHMLPGRRRSRRITHAYSCTGKMYSCISKMLPALFLTETLKFVVRRFVVPLLSTACVKRCEIQFRVQVCSKCLRFMLEGPELLPVVSKLFGTACVKVDNPSFRFRRTVDNEKRIRYWLWSQICEVV